MPTTTKAPGAPCPSCHAAFCAEYVKRDGEPRWSCSCGASGTLSGNMSIRTKAAAPAPASEPARGQPGNPHPHWSQRKGG